MSAYDNDPRVSWPTKSGLLFHVAWCEGKSPARVRQFLHGPSWVVWRDDEDPKTEWQEFDTADEAIQSLIGDPR